MRLTAFLLIGFLQVSAAGNAQKISVSGENLSLKTIFKTIEKQTEYVFVYDENILTETKAVTVHMNNTTVTELLDKCLRDQPVLYSISGKTIFIKKKLPQMAVEMPKITKANNQIVGFVQTEDGKPLEGATVTLKPNEINTVTNERGQFFFPNIPEGSYKLIITFIGYEKYEHPLVMLKEEIIVNAILKPAANTLDETVIKGYYNTTQRLNTGDISTIKSTTIEKQPVGNVLQALSGRIPGLEITQGSGAPGSFVKVLIRGQNSIASGNNPLVLIDGVPFNTTTMTSPYFSSPAGVSSSPFNYINPNDIESVAVLKDADATAIYGTRGANGVVLITTKRPSIGKTSFTVNFYAGAGAISRRPEMLNTQQYLKMRHEALNNDGITTPAASQYDINGKWDTTRYTDWTKYLIGGVANVTDINGAVSGGANKTQFLISFGYRKEGTVYPGSFFDEKGSVHVSFSHTSLDDKFSSSFNAFYLRNNNILPQVDFANYVTLAPDAPALFDSSGALNWQKSTWINPASYALQKSASHTSNLNSDWQVKYKLLPNFEIKTNFGFTSTSISQIITTPKASQNPALASAMAFSNFANGNVQTWTIEPQISYNKKILGGIFDGLLGATLLNQQQSSLALSGIGYNSDALIENIQAASSIAVKGNTNSVYKYSSLFARVGYVYENKYVLNITTRRDGSSRFGPGKRYANFGAAGLAWILSSEKFMSKFSKTLSYAKIRLSYGVTGNDQIGDYQYLETFQPTGATYQGSNNLTPTQLFNANYAWEENKKFEVGTEMGFFKDRILISANYYKNKCSNQLVGLPLPQIAGFGSVNGNLPAVVQNSGFEFQVSSVNVKSQKCSWTSIFTLTIPRNKLLSFPGIEGSAYSTIYVVGQPLSIRKVFENTGVDSHTGVYTFTDYDHNGAISYPEDLQKIVFTGNKFYGGFVNNFKYKDLEFELFFQFVEEPHAINYLGVFGRPGAIGNQPIYVLNRWQTNGDNASIQKFSSANASAATSWSYARTSSLSYTDASYIRLKNVSISYNLSSSIVKSVKQQQFILFLRAQNLLTISRYRGFDPETKTILPTLKTFAVGCQITL